MKVVGFLWNDPQNNADSEEVKTNSIDELAKAVKEWAETKNAEPQDSMGNNFLVSS